MHETTQQRSERDMAPITMDKSTHLFREKKKYWRIGHLIHSGGLFSDLNEFFQVCQPVGILACLLVVHIVRHEER